MTRAALALLAILTAVATLQAEVTWRDDFDSSDPWEVIASDGVRASVHTEPGLTNSALRLDVNFEAGSGFCVIRRKLDVALPDNYRFRFDLRSDLPPNNLEFKLVDAALENVWWVNRRAFEFPSQWSPIAYRKRHFVFAWGPSGGKPIEKLGAIEFAIAASSGGKGSVWFDNLVFETLPPPQPASEPVQVHTSSRGDGAAGPVALPDDGRFSWSAAESDAAPSIRIDFGQPRELGGLSIDWRPDHAARDYDVLLSPDGKAWELAQAVRDRNGGRDHVLLPDAEAMQVRIDVKAADRQPVGTSAILVRPADFGSSKNRLYATLAQESPRGMFPRYCHGRQQAWTIVGVPTDAKEALIDADGAVEVDKGAWRIEPFVVHDGRLYTWADVETRQTLSRGYVPIPSVHWSMESLRLGITALADGEPNASTLHIRYRLTSDAARPVEGTLFLALRPFQVLTPWHDLNMAGGATRMRTISAQSSQIVVDGTRALHPWTRPEAFGAATFAQGDIVEHIMSGTLPTRNAVDDPMQLASAALRFDYKLDPGETRDFIISVPFYGVPADAPPYLTPEDAASRYDAALQAADSRWDELITRVELRLPPQAERLTNTFRSLQGYILINADGPRIQPGSRTYERSWIRDGSLESTALLYTGHPEQVRAFLDWYAPFQYPSGKVPCVVDHRGPDPVPEHDSTGQLIYALWKYYRFTGDRALLERHFERVVRGVDYIESLRTQRMTHAFEDGPPEERAKYGLVTESISHEGYSAKPMHSYWDSFFVVRGLKDARAIAALLDRPEMEQNFARLLADYRRCLYDSMRLAMRNKQIDYIPGCAELGDFDATSTAIGLFPCGEHDHIPQPQLKNTFDRYFRFFEDRAAGRIEWRDYTPYEVRIIGAFIRLGQPARAHALIDFFLGDQQPIGWNQWGEISYRDKTFPGFVGDMPHTWVGADFISAVRSLFVYEREEDEALVLLAGVKREWLENDPYVTVRNFPTEYGVLSYTARLDNNELVVRLDGDLRVPRGEIVVVNPLDKPIRGFVLNGEPRTTFDERSATFDLGRGEVRIKFAE